MALPLIEPKNSQRSNLLIGKNYEVTLNQAIQNLVSETHSEKTQNLSHFINVFYELMQSKIDPPLETIWVYSALTFRSRKAQSHDLSSRVLIAKELFQLLSGCSGPFGSSKSIALLALVVFEVYRLVVDLLGKDLNAKRVKKVVKEVNSLIGVVLGYVSVCRCKDLGNESNSNLVVPFKDLVGFWLDGNEGLESFLPLVSGEIRREVSVGETSVNYLAGVVIAELLLLKLCFDLRVGDRGVELEKELRSWTVGSITGFQSFYFFETLVRMLMEPTLPVTSLVRSEDEVLLRTILYDAALLVEYSFLSPERVVHLPAEHVRSLTLKRLIITHEAIEFFGKKGEPKRAISYTSSFSNSQLPSQIIRRVTSQIGTEEAASRLNGSSPKALIKWLLVLEGQGIRLFDDSVTKLRAKSAVDDSKTDYEQPSSKLEDKSTDPDLMFYIDSKGEEIKRDEDDGELNESVSAAFVAAAHTMRLTEKVERKRKDQGSTRKRKRIKFLKHDVSDISDSDRENSSSVSNDGLSSESEIENPISDEDV